MRKQKWTPAQWQRDPESVRTETVQYWTKSGTMMTAMMKNETAKDLVKQGLAFVITSQAIGEL